MFKCDTCGAEFSHKARFNVHKKKYCIKKTNLEIVDWKRNPI